MASSTLHSLTEESPGLASEFYSVKSPFGSGDDRRSTGKALTQGLQIPRMVYMQGLPMLIAPTGTTTAGGAFTLGTAIQNSVFYNSAYCYFPAGTTAPGDPAGWYYCTFSSTTAGQMYRDSYTPSSTPPAVPGSPTVPTGAANWTGVTSAVTVTSFSVPANDLGANGELWVPDLWFHTINNANAKTYSVTFGAFTAVNSISLSGASMVNSRFRVASLGNTNNQVSNSYTGAAAAAILVGTVDTTANVTVSLTITRGTATDPAALLPFKALICR